MVLTKAQSIAVAVGTIGLFFVAGVVLLQSRDNRPPVESYSEIEAEKPVAAPTVVSGTVPDLSGTPAASAFTLNRFQRSEVKNGRKLWEVEGERGQYYPENSTAVVTKANLKVFSQNGDVITVQADQATLFIAGASLTKAELVGAVRAVRNDEVTITTDSAVYDPKNDKVVAPGLVKLQSATFDVSGEGMEVTLSTKRVKLLSNVESVVRPKTQEQEHQQ